MRQRGCDDIRGNRGLGKGMTCHVIYTAKTKGSNNVRSQISDKYSLLSEELN